MAVLLLACLEDCCTRLILYTGAYMYYQQLDVLFGACMLYGVLQVVLLVVLLVVGVLLLVVVDQVVGVWEEKEHPYQVPLEVLLVRDQAFGIKRSLYIEENMVLGHQVFA